MTRTGDQETINISTISIVLSSLFERDYLRLIIYRNVSYTDYATSNEHHKSTSQMNRQPPYLETDIVNRQVDPNQNQTMPNEAK